MSVDECSLYYCTRSTILQIWSFNTVQRSMMTDSGDFFGTKFTRPFLDLNLRPDELGARALPLCYQAD